MHREIATCRPPVQLFRPSSDRPTNNHDDPQDRRDPMAVLLAVG
jgi:hypothetical protein